MQKDRLNTTRRLLLWALEHPPFDPYVTASVAVDFTPGRAYLDALNARTPDGVRVSLMHLVVAAFARAYVEFPMANAAIVGHDILRYPDVGVLMPVNLLAERDGGVAPIETSMALAEAVDTLCLRGLSAETTKKIESERAGTPSHAWVRTLVPIFERAPHVTFRAFLEALDAASRIGPVARFLHRQIPASLVVSNPGSALPMPPGALARGATFSPPRRIRHFGSMVGVFPLQDEVIAVDGAPAVRPMLPLSYIFDHRLFDGVMGGKILSRVAEILRAPADVFGEDGEAPIGRI